ncbi:MAG: AraC family transcriptional regulator [Kofleriaceae bacterium]|nr:AraC family transcriptional regulator [Kofleriaceae bacterium]
MNIQSLATQVADYLHETDNELGVANPLPGLWLFEQSKATEHCPMLYEPVVCLILQGQKEIVLETSVLTITPGTSLLVSHDLPVISCSTPESTSKPYLAIVLALDLPLLRSLYEEVSSELGDPGVRAHSIAVEECDPRLIDCLSRYLLVAGDPIETKVMAPLILREIHFRLLRAGHGGMLRELLRYDSYASTIARAIARIRRDFRQRMVVPELAQDMGMSSSSFHKHFKAITSVTPLQYQKELRLFEAKRLLSACEGSVSEVAFEVGYESPNQFSREFTRKFGVSPRDV